MFRQLVVFLALVTLGIGAPAGVGSRPRPRPRAANTCTREEGVYDVCDTMHSFLRCRGNRPTMVFDCAHSPDHYCLIQNDKGSCMGLRPPPMNSTITIPR
ncbi:hypothetical protein F4802DRAFT_498149 [Xylaria palmicola]|nr:hypothetical protein F4802DRAFT_498149 [Xylaria palmicola]